MFFFKFSTIVRSKGFFADALIGALHYQSRVFLVERSFASRPEEKYTQG